jgi:hypothetical protein
VQPVSVEAWARHIPKRFLDACAPLPTLAEAETQVREWRSLDQAGKLRYEEEQPWTFEAWMGWFDWSSDLRRSWLWWDGGTLDEDRFWIEVEVSEDPAPVGTLKWMMRAAGAQVVTEQRTDSTGAQ